VRRELLALPAPAERYAGRKGPLRVLVFGGSQGARFLNQRVPAWLGRTGRAVTVRHQSGEQDREAARAAYGEQGVEAEVIPFIDDMAGAYAWADLVVCRAGAATVAELAAVGVPAVLVPYPHAVDDHQRRNAEALVSRDAALCVTQADWDDAALAARLDGELGERDRLAEMGQAARAFARPDAAAVVADACLQEVAHAAA
jgi:UDP-N-acetylglucosamine--N-acetylmuramyl-(pentapeptide) pyrophosphoryl-undecaprenol N-acetylglucosamine transferase